jgi:hypothetical protein
MGVIMKRYIAFLLIFLTVFSQMGTIFALQNANVNSVATYLSYRNEIRLDYWGYSAAVNQIRVYYVSPTGTVYDKTFDQSDLTGIFYLTCNGTYTYYLENSTGGVEATISDIDTSQIVNGSCSSYAAGGYQNNIGLTTTPTPTGGTLNWNPVTGACNYEIYQNGVLIQTTTGTSFSVSGGGAITVRAVDCSGLTVGEGDSYVTPSSGSPPPSPTPTPSPSYPPTDPLCTTCVNLHDLLNCPDWGKYMGDFTKAVKDALPPPPNWDDIADKIGVATINHLKDYIGVVPDAPTQTEIDSKINTTLPPVNITQNDADKLVPVVPPGFSSPKPFDITAGPQIPIHDDSVPFIIPDPLNNIVHDDPGIPVIPGDPRNNTGGIQKPTTTSYPMVTPKPLPSALPNNPVPIPRSSPGSAPTPMPIGTGGNGPIPIYKP